MKRLPDRPLLAGLIVALLTLAAYGILTFRNGIPEPRVQDEFSYLLAADTFCHGRVANPTPEFWKHFESPHVLVEPTYMSKYPPGQGLALALGQFIAHEPILGVWLSGIAATAAIYWMLLAFVPRPWPLLGGIVAALHIQLLSWSQVYWGGSVAVFGAALLLGAAARWKQKPSALHAVIAAIALLILANTRPYEGFILSIPVLIFAAISPSPGTPGEGRGEGRIYKTVGPAIIVLLFGAIAMANYNYRITSHPLRMPTVQYSDEYDLYPKFWFLPKHPTPAYDNDVMRDVHTTWEHGDYDSLRTVAGFTKISARRLWQLISIHAQPIILLVPLAAGLIWLDAWIWITLVVFLVGIFAESWFLPHYAAPIFPLAILIITIGWRRLGKIVGSLTAIAFLALVVIHIATPPDAPRVGCTELIAMNPPLQTGQHLIFVKYDPGHLLDDEWVYNSADIPTQRIIWARSLTPKEDEALASFYSTRHIWLLDVGEQSLTLNPFKP